MIRGRIAILALLTALNLINYLDRYVIVAIGPRIQESLHLNDARYGWVGSAFMIGYMITSPFFGWLGDRYSRKGLIACGIIVWSAATALSGLAQSLAPLIAARIVVGVGEASYATLGPTIIDDIASARAKNRYLAAFYTAIPIGSALGFIVGGAIEVRYGWRTAFYVAGAPGLALAVTTLFIEEPERVTLVINRGSGDGLRATLGALGSVYRKLAKTPLYVMAVAGYVAQTFALGGFTFWAAPFLYRKLCMELNVASYVFGAVTVVTGVIGTSIGGLIADRFKSEDNVRAALRICAWSSFIAAPLALAALLMPTARGAILMIGICEIAVFVSIAPVNAALLQAVPQEMRATSMAVSLFAIHILGDLISPPMVGAVSDAFGDPQGFCTAASGLQIGMYLLPLALFVSALLWWFSSRKATGVPAPPSSVA